MLRVIFYYENMSTVEEIAPSDVVTEEKSVKEYERWDDLDLKEDLLRGIYNYGFENPSPIQKKAIKPIIDGHDVIAQAQSGSGKTGTFAISTLQNIDPSLKETQAIILAPTHELVKQIASVITSIGNVFQGLCVKTLVGGSPVSEDAALLRENPPHIVVGCTGRVCDMMNRGHLPTKSIKLLILDEADEMLARGFKDTVYHIFQKLSRTVQVALFSATMPPEMLRLTERFMRNPVSITVKAEQLNLECIQQYYIALQNDESKYNTIKSLFEHLLVSQCIIYVNSVNRVVDLYNAMMKEGYAVCCIHSSMDKTSREKTMADFRRGTFRVLISSNVTARGIDVQQVSTVINFDIPRCVHTYLHRIGRSGRWGRKGLAINLITRYDISTMQTIEKHYRSNILELPGDFRVGS